MKISTPWTQKYGEGIRRKWNEVEKWHVIVRCPKWSNVRRAIHGLPWRADDDKKKRRITQNDLGWGGNRSKIVNWPCRHANQWIYFKWKWVLSRSICQLKCLCVRLRGFSFIIANYLKRKRRQVDVVQQRKQERNDTKTKHTDIHKHTMLRTCTHSPLCAVEN